MKRKIFFFIFGIIFLSTLQFSSAYVYEQNLVYEGTINSNGDLVTSSTPVNNINVLGFVCSDSSCSGVSGTLWGGNVQTSNTNEIILRYPTNLLSSNGYGVYIYKDGYIPWEISADWRGEGNVGPYNNSLTKKESCISTINNFQVSVNSQTVNVNAVVNSPIEHSGDLDYMPSQLTSQYSTKVDVHL